MDQPASDFAARRFQSAATHYLAGRPPYHPDLVKRIIQLTELHKNDRVLDLGCGPGQLAVAFAPFVGEVVAMDPEPEMLDVARTFAETTPNMKIVQGGSADISDALGAFRAVVIARAFHWMDRVPTLRRFETLIAEDGAVVLVAGDRSQVQAPPWIETFRSILSHYGAGDAGPPGGGVLHQHIPILLDSAFSRLEQIEIIWNWEFGGETLVNRALSVSGTSRARLGARADEMIAELRAAFPADKSFSEVIASSALIARRP